MAEVKPDIETFARIKVIGVGGSGSNAINRMIECQLKGIDFVAINTDAQDLHHNKATEKIHIGKNLTRGLGAGMNPEIGRQAAEENRDEIHEVIKGTDMVFVVYGSGGGTGSGAGPVIAEVSKEAGALTVGVVTKPFSFEGKQRSSIAEESIDVLRDRVDTLITIQNDKLLQIIDKNTSLVNAFGIVDDVLRQGVQGISDLITRPGIVNVDFADISAVMKDSGSALMGIGVATGDNRAVDAAKTAINSPLLDISIDGAKGVLFNITGGEDITMMEVNEAASTITQTVDDNAKIIFGASLQDESVKEGEIRITVVATGFDLKPEEQGFFGSEGRIKLMHEKNDDKEDASTNRLEDKNYHSRDASSFDNDDFSSEKISIDKNDLFGRNSNPDSHYKENTSNRRFEVEVEDEDELEIPAFIRKKLGK